MGLMCCNPLALILGVVAVVFSGKAQNAANSGNLGEAESAASTAKICAIIASVLIGLSVIGACGGFATGGFDQYQQQLDVNF